MSGTSTATAHGASQTPLNLLQRKITLNRRLSKITRSHIRTAIRKVKAGGLAAIHDSVEAALYMRAYAEITRLDEKLDGLDVMDKAYKPTIWSITKLTEVIAKFKPRKESGSSRSGRPEGNGASALWQGPKAEEVASEDNADTA